MLLTDRVGPCTYCTTASLRHLLRIARIAFRRIFGRARCSIQLADPRGMNRTLDGSTEDAEPESGVHAAAETPRLTVALASHGSRPKMREILDDFAKEAAAAVSAAEPRPKMMVAAGGPNALFGSLDEVMPDGMTYSRLTFPM